MCNGDCGEHGEPILEQTISMLKAIRLQLEAELQAAGKALKRGQSFVTENCRGYPPQIDRAIR